MNNVKNCIQTQPALSHKFFVSYNRMLRPAVIFNLLSLPFKVTTTEFYMILSMHISYKY